MIVYPGNFKVYDSSVKGLFGLDAVGTPSRCVDLDYAGQIEYVRSGFCESGI